MSGDRRSGLDSEAKRLALEAIATLVNVKKTAAKQVLKPSGVSEELIRRFLFDRDDTTGEKRSKREAGAALLEELEKSGRDQDVVKRLVALAARWDAFHLAQDEYKARAVVQKARALEGSLADADAKEKAERERWLRDQREQKAKEEREATRLQSALLLAQFDYAASEEGLQKRGYFLEDLLGRLFDLHHIPVTHAFRRNSGGEQIDAAFEMDGWHYIVECRWRTKLADIAQLDALLAKVGRSGHQTMGMFVSIEGWSDNVVPLLKQNTAKRVFLADGYDIRCVLGQHVDLRNLLKAKLLEFNLRSEPFYSVRNMLKAS